jgi:excinuclease ABC subunit C
MAPPLTLRQRLKSVPKSPGIYRWKDARGRVLYIGKAVNLRRRMQSYLRDSAKLENFRKRGLTEKMADFDVTVTDTEVEALILEMHLIRASKPKYNVALTRDEHYVHVRVGLNETFPSVTVTSLKEDDGALYFGPFTNPWSQRQMLLTLRDLFPFRTCAMQLAIDPQPSLFTDQTLRLPLQIIAKKRDRRVPCLDFHIKKCSGPCTGEIDAETYRHECIDGVIAFYEGRYGAVIDLLITRMKAAAAERKFERAMDISHTLKFIEQLTTQRRFHDPSGLHADVIATARQDDELQIVRLSVRGGRIIDEESLGTPGAPDGDNDALTQYIVQRYADAKAPPALVMPQEYTETALLKRWFKRCLGKQVRILRPAKGSGKRLLDLAARNAQQKLALKAEALHSR